MHFIGPFPGDPCQLGVNRFVIAVVIIIFANVTDPFVLVCFIRDELFFGCSVQIHLVSRHLIAAHGIRQLCYFVLIIGVFDFSDLFVEHLQTCLQQFCGNLVRTGLVILFDRIYPGQDTKFVYRSGCQI